MCEFCGSERKEVAGKQKTWRQIEVPRKNASLEKFKAADAAKKSLRAISK